MPNDRVHHCSTFKLIRCLIGSQWSSRKMWSRIGDESNSSIHDCDDSRDTDGSSTRLALSVNSDARCFQCSGLSVLCICSRQVEETSRCRGCWVERQGCVYCSSITVLLQYRPSWSCCDVDHRGPVAMSSITVLLRCRPSQSCCDVIHHGPVAISSITVLLRCFPSWSCCYVVHQGPVAMSSITVLLLCRPSWSCCDVVHHGPDSCFRGMMWMISWLIRRLQMILCVGLIVSLDHKTFNEFQIECHVCNRTSRFRFKCIQLRFPDDCFHICMFIILIIIILIKKIIIHRFVCANVQWSQFK